MESRPSLSRDLSDAYETYDRYSFLPDPQSSTFVKRWQARIEKAGLLFLRMPLLAVALLRLRDGCLRNRVPLLPYVCEIASNSLWRVSIGRPVEIGQGLIIPHGNVVIDGKVRIGRDCVINPWVTIGLNRRRGTVGLDPQGPVIGDRVFIGTGARILGAVTVGSDARIGANAVVIDNIPAGATAVGIPARVVQTSPPRWELDLRALAEGSDEGQTP